MAAVEIARLRKTSGDQPWIDWDAAAIVVGSELRPLQSTELKLMRALTAVPGKVVSRARLLSALYGDREDGGPLTANRALAVYICRLRKKSPWPIRTLWSDGFVLEGYRPPPRATPELRVVEGITRARLMAGR